jgi:hypothetical protein
MMAFTGATTSLMSGVKTSGQPAVALASIACSGRPSGISFLLPINVGSREEGKAGNRINERRDGLRCGVPKYAETIRLRSDVCSGSKALALDYWHTPRTQSRLCLTIPAIAQRQYCWKQLRLHVWESSRLLFWAVLRPWRSQRQRSQ